tara:strand:- start:47 stop:442 length:396 start_codon:yes stop_codon:yes gene_type:complete
MSHFAKVDKNNIVQTVNVVTNKQMINEQGVEDENLGIAHLHKVHGAEGTWVQTSFNTFGGKHELGGVPLRKNYAGIGYTYDEVRDAFIPPKPFASWTLNEDTCQWEAPTAHPDDGKRYSWNEDTTSWDEIS